MKLKIKKVHALAKTPTFGTSGAACFDLYTVDAVKHVEANKVYKLDTGLQFEVPSGYAMLIYPRSSMGVRGFVGNTGVVDSDYRGNVFVTLGSLLTGETIKVGDRVAQARIVPIQHVDFEEVDELTSTARGAGGHGSTGR